MPKHSAIHTYKTVYKGIAELGFIIKKLSQAGLPCDAPFKVLCISFQPLVRKTISGLVKTRIPVKDLEQEVLSTLFEAILAFKWNLCKDENFFKFFSSYIRQHLRFIPKWRLRKETRELPKLPMAYEGDVYEEESSKRHPEMAVMLKRVEQELGTKHADMLFCLFSLRMTQEDTGKVLGFTQKGVNWLWRTSLPKLRKVLKKTP